MEAEGLSRGDGNVGQEVDDEDDGDDEEHACGAGLDLPAPFTGRRHISGPTAFPRAVKGVGG